MGEEEERCPCCSGRSYAQCCEPYHKGVAVPEHAVALMRSRYAAYARHLPDYLMATTHPGSPYYRNDRHLWRRALTKFSQSHTFHKLEVVATQEEDPFAVVIFVAHLSHPHGSATFSEKSFFEKWRGRWYYQRGELHEGETAPFGPLGPLHLLPLAYYGTPLLRKKAETIALIDDDLRSLAASMVETMDACGGLGLAAPQVHRSLRLFVMHIPIEEEGKLVDLGPVRVLLNPEITARSQEKWVAPEGCLSIPTVEGEVERPEQITLRYLTLDGETVTLHAAHWEARVIQHEYDHLEGILFLDHLTPKAQKQNEPLLRALEKRLSI